MCDATHGRETDTRTLTCGGYADGFDIVFSHDKTEVRWSKLGPIDPRVEGIGMCGNVETLKTRYFIRLKSCVTQCRVPDARSHHLA